MTVPTAPSTPIGTLLREWRERRRLSQLDLATQAEISTRHLSFVETGRSRPTPQMIVRLTEHLEVPLRERNLLLLAGGYAPAYPQHCLDDPELAGVRNALRLILDAHAPYPALVLDRWWNMIEGNTAVAALLDNCAPHLLEPPVNVLRLTLHPDGLASHITNLAQWRGHLLERVAHRVRVTGDETLESLLAEMRTYPGGSTPVSGDEVVLPMRLQTRYGELSMFTITAAVETAADVTVHELVIESFYPTDRATAEVLHRLDGEPKADDDVRSRTSVADSRRP